MANKGLTPEMLVFLDRNLLEIERQLSITQTYQEDTVKEVIDNNGKLKTDKLDDKMVGLEHALQIAEQAVTTAKIALKAVTEALLADGAVTNMKLAAGAVTEAKTNWQTHLLSDYGIADNTPMVGFISWSGVKIVYKGVEYEVMDGSTDKLYVWWDFDYPTIMQTAQTLPTMTDDDVLVFLNKNGTHLVVPKATVVDGSLLVSESVLTDALAANAVTAIKIAAGAVQTAALAAGAVTAEKISVENLAAISANLGTVNAGFINVGDKVLDITDMATAHDGQVQNDANVTAYFPFDDSLYDSKNLVQCTFNRDSVAYLPNGTQVGTDIARYDTARIVRGVLIEEGTTNLLTENESSVETDLIGLSSEVINGTGTFTRDTTKKKYGNASAKLTCSSINPGGWMDIYVDKSITGGLAYTFSVNFLASVVSGTRSVRVFVDWYNGSTFLSRTDTAGVTVSPSMSDFIRLSVSDVAPANASRGVFVLILVDLQVDDALYWDGAQLEQKPYPTSWTLGGTTRAPETLTIPTAGIFEKGNWTVELTFNVKTLNNRINHMILFDVYKANICRYVLYIDKATKCLVAHIISDGSLYTITDSEPIVSDNWYSIMWCGNGSIIKLFKNGVQIGNDTNYVETIGSLPSSFKIGGRWDDNNTSQINGIIDELRFSKIARTLEEHQSYYNSGKGYTDIEPIIRAGQEYKGFMITQQDGAKAYSSDGGYTTMNSKGVITKGGNFKIYDEKNILVMDGRGVNPLEVSGWGITSGLTFAVQSLTPTSNYIEVQTTSSLPYSQTLPYNLYLNDVSKLGSSGKLISLNNLNYSIALYYNAVDTVNKYVTVYSRDSQVDVNIGYYLVAAEVNGVTQPAPSAIARLLIKAGSAILRNGTYIKFPNDITYDMPVSVSLGDADGWQYRVLFINGNGQITHLATGTAGSLIDKWGIDTYPAHPRYNNIGTGTPDPNCIVLGTILCGGTKNYSFNAHEIMHPDFRDERALKVNNLVYSLPAYYGDVKTIEKSVLTTSAVSIGSWTTNSISLSSGQKYEVAVPIGKGKRMAIVSFCGVAVDLSYQDTSFTGAVLFVGLKNPWKRAWQPCISIGYGDHFIDSYFQDAYGNFVVHENSMGWTYRRITDAYLNIGVDGETYFHFVLYQRTNSENRGLRVNWFAF
jgi:hypothetical protein